MRTKELPKSLSVFLDNHLLKVETTLVLITAVGYLLKASSIDYGSLIFSLGLTLLPIIYFLMAFVQQEGKNLMLITSKKVIYISYSVVLIGLYFTWNEYPGAESLINIGSITLLLSILLFVFASSKNWQSKYMIIIMRALILLTLVVLFTL